MSGSNTHERFDRRANISMIGVRARREHIGNYLVRLFLELG
jgi:hypothetical protein